MHTAFLGFQTLDPIPGGGGGRHGTTVSHLHQVYILRRWQLLTPHGVLNISGGQNCVQVFPKLHFLLKTEVCFLEGLLEGSGAADMKEVT